jgi:hypothetical protein
VTAEQELIAASARLARASPESWNEFVKKFNVYSWYLAEVLVASPPDMLVVNQGRAQGVAALGRILATCREKFEAMDKNQSTKKEGS